jgi:hypothetical protein
LHGPRDDILHLKKARTMRRIDPSAGVTGGSLLGSPVAAALAFPLVFGVLLLVQGIALVIWAFRLRG